MIVMNGTITLVQPLSISLGKTENGGFPIITRYVDDVPEPTGFLPATTLRGRLRRGHVLKQMQEAAAASQHYSLKRAYSEMIGQDPESEKEAGEIDLQEVKSARESSPVLDLYGSGLGMASRLRVSNFFPVENTMPEQLQTFRKDLDASEAAVLSLVDDDRERFYNRKELNSRRSKWEGNIKTLNRNIAAAKKKKEATAELEKQLKEADQKLKEVVDEMGDMMQVSSLLPIEWYALPPGLKLHGKIVVANPKDTDMPILEDGFNSLSLDPILGAASARGCGEIEGEFEVKVDGERKKMIRFGGYEPAQIENL